MTYLRLMFWDVSKYVFTIAVAALAVWYVYNLSKETFGSKDKESHSSSKKKDKSKK